MVMTNWTSRNKPRADVTDELAERSTSGDDPSHQEFNKVSEFTSLK
jgi:hypothetical protein